MSARLRGQCLIAATHLKDPHFFKTVVLIVEHGEHGAMGLVLNRPSTILVSHALSKHFDLPNTGDLVHVGGPVEPAALLVLHNAGELSNEEPAVAPGVYIGSSAEAFEEVVRRIGAQDEWLRYRIYSGCAGWAPGQLEGELARGDWFTADPLPDIVYADDPYEIYPRMLQHHFEAHRLLPHPDANPQWN